MSLIASLRVLRRSPLGRSFRGAWLPALVIVLCGALGAQADVEPDEAPDKAGTGVPEMPKQENPLPKIVELMREVEQALADSHADQPTQAQQQKIVEALEFGNDALEQLAKLIEMAENSAQSSGQGGGSQSESGQPSPGSSGQRRRSGQTRRDDPNAKGTNPQEQGKSDTEKRGAQNETTDPNQAQNDKKSAGANPDDPSKAGANQPKAGGEWGNLPMKEAREMMESQRRKMPQKYREQLERYYKGLSEGKR
ncbi:MAG: hypothetical protein ACYS22_01840 [Planctomycetota bacterium]